MQPRQTLMISCSGPSTRLQHFAPSPHASREQFERRPAAQSTQATQPTRRIQRTNAARARRASRAGIALLASIWLLGLAVPSFAQWRMDQRASAHLTRVADSGNPMNARQTEMMGGPMGMASGGVSPAVARNTSDMQRDYAVPRGDLRKDIADANRAAVQRTH